MNEDKYPAYLLYTMGFYILVFIYTVFFFLIPAATMGLTREFDFWLYLFFTLLPVALSILYIYDRKFLFIQEHDLIFRLLISGSVVFISFIVIVLVIPAVI